MSKSSIKVLLVFKEPPFENRSKGVSYTRENTMLNIFDKTNCSLEPCNLT